MAKKHTCIASIKMITDRPGRRTVRFQEITSKLESLVTALLEQDFDESQVNELIDNLRELGCHRSEIETWVMTCLAYHEALGSHHATGDWQKCKEKWFSACERFGISQWVVGQAIEFGQRFRGQLYREGKEKKEVVMRLIYDYFFNSDGVLKELNPKPKKTT